MTDQHDLAVAFAVTVGAGMSTALGSLIVFMPRLYSSALLAICLAVSAGVMVFVSFVEILVKASDEFEIYFDKLDNVNRTLISAEDYEPSNSAFHATIAMFFAGVVVTWALDRLIHFLYATKQRREASDEEEEAKNRPADSVETKVETVFIQSRETTDSGQPYGLVSRGRVFDVDEVISAGVQEEHSISVLNENRHNDAVAMELTDFKDTLTQDNHTRRRGSLTSDDAIQLTNDIDSRGSGEALAEQGRIEDATQAGVVDRKKMMNLVTTALITGTAIALHNFPEGLATFVATAKDPAVGAPLGVAIAVHNIPEGICVAIPFYFASRSRWKSFLLGTLSGVAEPLAGAIGWAILSRSDADLASLTYAILFALVAGMMVYISFRELLPTARAYDRSDRYVTLFLFVGMVIMAASLMLFRV